MALSIKNGDMKNEVKEVKVSMLSTGLGLRGRGKYETCKAGRILIVLNLPVAVRHIYWF